MIKEHQLNLLLGILSIIFVWLGLYSITVLNNLGLWFFWNILGLIFLSFILPDALDGFKMYIVEKLLRSFDENQDKQEEFG